MAKAFTRMVQVLWLLVIGLSLLLKLYQVVSGAQGEFSLLSILIPALVSLPLSALALLVLTVMDVAGLRPWLLANWLAQWGIMTGCGYVQWFVIVPRLVRLLQRRMAGSIQQPPPDVDSSALCDSTA